MKELASLHSRGMLGGRKLRNLCLVTVSQGLLCPFELAQLGKVRVGTNVVSWVQLSLVDIQGQAGVLLGLAGSIFLLS